MGDVDFQYLSTTLQPAEEKGISCELLELDFLKCSVGFPFMRAQSKYHLGVIFDTSHLSGDEENLQFLVSAQSANPEHEGTLSDNTLHLSIPLIHEVDTTITGVVSPTSFVYGDSVNAARFVQMDDMECLFQPLNYTFQVGQEGGNCTYHRNPTPCTVPQDWYGTFQTIFAFFTKSGRKVVDTSSVIQFVTRGNVMVDTSLRAAEVSNGLSEHTTVVFEALHNLEPRGYVVGWIIAISLLVGILIFLLLAVLLWKMGFFRRRYIEIIKAEKNRKESDESWDWVQKSQ
ncbi:UNVERIFIED_CONTAM: hypothetical protein FKN15_003129 [Acipenser sinensis]